MLKARRAIGFLIRLIAAAFGLAGVGLLQVFNAIQWVASKVDKELPIALETYSSSNWRRYQAPEEDDDLTDFDH